jgi:hypothetical protein
MSALLLEVPPIKDLFHGDVDQDLLGASRWNRVDGPGRLTLDDLITSVWEGLASEKMVRCPACGGTMRSRPAAPEVADCSDCGASLA